MIYRILRSISWVILLLIPFNLFGQGEIEVSGKFLADSTKVGNPVPYQLTAKYPKSLEIIFPDEQYDLKQFEITSKKYFTTQSDDTYSYDSAIFMVSTFSNQLNQELAIPVIWLKSKQDSVIIEPKADKIAILRTFVAEVDAPEIQEDSEWTLVREQLNLIVTILIISIILIAGGLIYYFFGGSIRLYLKVRAIEQSWRKHEKAYEKALQDLKSGNKEEGVRMLYEHKYFLEKLEGKPLTGQSTREMMQFYPEAKSLHEHLKVIDAYIYADRKSDQLLQAYQGLLSFAKDKKEEIKKQLKDTKDER
ncbi:MAG: hypothetical protein LAT68_03485 [Cyclobacteriaceae bacterium]|nr:hypothetical protein [Cyclobacteriaceae bacterium]MCH8515371.1 hypothetical protein [Cyclobacteriaceae bacterium]